MAVQAIVPRPTSEGRLTSTSFPLVYNADGYTFRSIARWENPMTPRWPPTRSWRQCRGKTRFRALVYLCSCLAAVGFPFAQGDDEKLRKQREDMVQTQIATLGGSGPERVQDSRVLDSMRKTPRDRFVPTELVPYAYDDRPVPIGYGQNHLATLHRGQDDRTP